MMHIGFTGTRAGMTPAQHQTLKEIIEGFDEPLTAHHGDCLGADEEFHDMVREAHFDAILHIHPPEEIKEQAFCTYDIAEPPKGYITRNHDIVDSSQLMFATPKEYNNVKRGSGTWATIRYSLKCGRQLAIIWPNGSISSY